MKNKYEFKILDTSILKNALKMYYSAKKDEYYDKDLEYIKNVYNKVDRIEKNIFKTNN